MWRRSSSRSPGCARPGHRHCVFRPDLRGACEPGRASDLFGLAAGIVLPVLFFYVLAHMIWRAQELRIIAQSMAEVAMRLAEPEDVARDSIVTVGQAIRREVAAMGDGVERALARAAELEALVHNEVSALERAYNDNEVRIRGLIEDLANQRDTLVGQAEQVRNAITGVHLDLTHDIASVSDLVAASVNDARAARHPHAHREGRAHHARARPRRRLHDRRARRARRRPARAADAHQPGRRAHARNRERPLTASLNFKTDHITAEFADMTTNLAQMLAGRLDQVTDNVSQRTLAIAETLMRRTDEISTSLTRTTESSPTR